MGINDQFELILRKDFENKLTETYYKKWIMCESRRAAQLGTCIAEMKDNLRKRATDFCNIAIPNIVRNSEFSRAPFTYVMERALEIEGKSPRQNWCFVAIRFNIEKNRVFVSDVLVRKL